MDKTGDEIQWAEVLARLQDELAELNEDFNRNFIKPNIVLSGKTGVGKSTLINAVFGFNEAETGVGRPVSQALIEYRIPEAPVHLFDTKGMELDLEQREISRRQIVSEIRKRASSVDAADHLHIMWYCISNESRRLESTEIEWIRSFSEYMPVVIVLTQTFDQNEAFLEFIKEELPHLPICRVLSKEKLLLGEVKIPPHGLTDLIDKTLDIIPEATRRAFTAAQKIEVERKIDSAKKLIQERLDSNSPVSYKNLAHAAEAFPIGMDVMGRSAVYLYMAKDIMTVMGIPVNRNFLKFTKEARPLLQSILLPFVASEGGRAIGKAALKYGTKQLSKESASTLAKLAGKTVGKANLLLSPVIGLVAGSFNRKVTESIANSFINTCADFLRKEISYKDYSTTEIMEKLSIGMKVRMNEEKEKIEKLAVKS
ncbi:50S ribosome-binding GTPase [Metabacillus sp. KIGAM252]|uniref:50S ribosome-binding GTPase n=1 Tax=Metabacillus flavus TaxID=2823519 RepID=A0ABS5LJH8_9BACI|nr:GTPase [Metabacillus flavus]MBS2970761.1 50S ribosome-binding GTPase [Metabacillus flavus]